MLSDDFAPLLDADLISRRKVHAKALLDEITARALAAQKANDAAIVAAREARIEVGRTHSRIREIVAGGK